MRALPDVAAEDETRRAGLHRLSRLLDHGLVTGLLAFIPNIGAIVSGVLMVAVGFSAGPHQGFYAIFVYFFVQNIDGYLVVPYIARRTVDLAPALVLAQGARFVDLDGPYLLAKDREPPLRLSPDGHMGWNGALWGG